VQFEENSFWVDFLPVSVLVQKLNHMEIQSHNLAVWSTMLSLSFSLSYYCICSTIFSPESTFLSWFT